MRNLLMPLTVAGLLSGCTTFGFAPPPVEVGYLTNRGEASQCTAHSRNERTEIPRTPPGALELIENFLLAYRCAGHEAAGDRIGFQVPSFLATITAALGTPFGLSEDGILAAAAGGAVADRANAYFAPKEKAALIDSALDAILCIKTEAVGIAYFDTTKPAPQVDAINAAANSAETAAATLENQARQLSEDLAETKMKITETNQPVPMGGSDPESMKAQSDLQSKRSKDRDDLIEAERRKSANLAGIQNDIRLLRVNASNLRLSVIPDNKDFIINKSVGSDVIQVNVGRQYFEMVAAALFSVERVLASRISNVGSFDSEGIAAQFKQLIGEKAEADAEKKAAENGAVGAVGGGGGTAKFATLGDKNAAVVELSLKSMQPRLQECVVRSKI